MEEGRGLLCADADCEFGGGMDFDEDWLPGAKEKWFDPAHMLAVFNQHYREIELRCLWDAAQPSVHAWGDVHGAVMLQAGTVETTLCSLTSTHTSTHGPDTRNLLSHPNNCHG